MKCHKCKSDPRLDHLESCPNCGEKYSSTANPKKSMAGLFWVALGMPAIFLLLLLALGSERNTVGKGKVAPKQSSREELIEEAKSAVRRELWYPDTATYIGLQVNSSGYVCGAVNSVDLDDSYTGYTRFVYPVASGKIIMAGSMKNHEFQTIWNSGCQ